MKSEEMLMLQALKLKKLNSKGYDGPDLVDQLVLQNPDAAKRSSATSAPSSLPNCLQISIPSAACLI